MTLAYGMSKKDSKLCAVSPREADAAGLRPLATAQLAKGEASLSRLIPLEKREQAHA